MIMKTREKQKLAFEHLLTNIIPLDADDILCKALHTNCISTISKGLIMNSDSIDDEDFLDDILSWKARCDIVKAGNKETLIQC